jgi:DNA processing protein
MQDALALSILLRSAVPMAALCKALEQAGSATALHALGPDGWRQAGFAQACIDRILRPDPRALALDAAWLAGAGHRLVGWHEDDYPGMLRKIDLPPAGLYVVGDVDLLWHPQVAVVGSRRPSAGGRDNARCFARAFAESGLAVCSGLAEGIDTEAHLGAMAAGRTVAVLGTGPDRCFPAANAGLMARIGTEGAIVTEHPPGTPGIASHFPSRNRLIAGLSLGTVVIEAALRSGALITARLSMEAGRPAHALPGSIHNPMARGCHRLIREGAGLVESPQELIESLVHVAATQAEALRGRLAAAVPDPDAAWTAERGRRGRPEAGPRGDFPAMARTGPGLFPPGPPQDCGEALLWRCLGHDPVNLDQLCQRTGLTLGPLSAMLLSMELDGRITAEHGRYIRRS